MRSGHRRRAGMGAVIAVLGLVVIAFVIYTMVLGQQSSPHAIDQSK